MKIHYYLLLYVFIGQIVDGYTCSAPSYGRSVLHRMPVSPSGEPGQVLHWLKDVNKMSTNDIKLLKTYILRHGAIVIKGQLLTDEQHINLTKSLGTPVDIPTTYFKIGNSATNENITIVPVSNYWSNGTWKGGKHSYGQYWHKDVNFLPEDKAHVLSILYAKEYKQGKNGGRTGFIDGCKARRELPENLEKIVKNVRFKFGTKLINDYQHAPEAHLDYFPEVERNVVFVHPKRKCECLNLAKTKFGFMIDDAINSNHEERLSAMEKTWNWLQQRPIYEHFWSEGDLVIWDNLAVFHRLLPYNDIGKKREFSRTYSRIEDWKGLLNHA